MEIRLLAVISQDDKREGLINSFAYDSEITIVGSGSDFTQAQLSSPEAHLANVIAVDLADPGASQAHFWTTLHLRWPAARVMVMIEQAPDERALYAALQAGAHSFALWAAPAEKLREAVFAAHIGERYYSAPWLIVAAMKAIKAVETGTMEGDETPVGADRPPDLTALESKVLDYLIQNEGKVLSPDELIRDVWQSDPSAGNIADQVRSCIKRLRRKLESDPRSRFQVLTVHGQGYRAVRKAGETKPEEN